MPRLALTGVNSNLATAIRTVVVLLMAWGMVFLILSGLATGASWLCYYKALQMGEASKVVPIDKLSIVITILLAAIFLHEQITLKSAIGCILIAAGTLLMVL